MFSAPKLVGSILISYGHHNFCLTYKPSNKKIVLPLQPQCPHLFLSRNNITHLQHPPPLPSPPPAALVEYIVGSIPAASELAISSSGLHGAHRRVAASSSLLVDVDATFINSLTAIRVLAGTKNSCPVGFYSRNSMKSTVNPNTTIHKHYHHGGAVCPSFGVGSMDPPDRTRRPSSEGVGRGGG